MILLFIGILSCVSGNTDPKVKKPITGVDVLITIGILIVGLLVLAYGSEILRLLGAIVSFLGKLITLLIGPALAVAGAILATRELADRNLDLWISAGGIGFVIVGPLCRYWADEWVSAPLALTGITGVVAGALLVIVGPLIYLLWVSLPGWIGAD